MNFAVASGGGAIVGATSAVTNASGIATAGMWTLGVTLATQTVNAAATGGATVVITGRATSAYLATVRYAGIVPADVQTRAQKAVDRIRTVVVGHVDDVAVSTFDLAGTCGVAGADPLDETVHDILFIVRVIVIDGAGGTAVRAVPCLNRVTQQGLVSVINVDVADYQNLIDNGTFDSTILHEMLHGLGFGVGWTGGNLSGIGTADPRFLGLAATAAFTAAGGISAPGVPIENVGPVGRINVHWRSTLFGDELMAGVIGGPARPFSAITARSLTDLGYVVNLFATDPFTFAGPAAIRRP